nr:MAG TPA: hypothetical protein [Caudoviricetes sp.]
MRQSSLALSRINALVECIVWTSTFCLRSPPGSKTLIQTERFLARFPKIFVHRTMDLMAVTA